MKFFYFHFINFILKSYSATSNITVFVIDEFYSAWIPEENIHDFPTHRSRFMLTQRIPRGYKEAIEAVEDALKSNPTEVYHKIFQCLEPKGNMVDTSILVSAGLLQEKFQSRDRAQPLPPFQLRGSTPRFSVTCNFVQSVACWGSISFSPILQ